MPHSIIYTDESCIIAGKARPNIPMVLDGNHCVDWILTDWLIHKQVVEGKSEKSTRKYATDLTIIASYFKKKKWDEIDYEDLLTYVSSFSKSDEYKGAQRVNLLVKALYHAQTRGNLVERLGIPDGDKKQYAIPVVFGKKKDQLGQTNDYVRSTITRTATSDTRIDIAEAKTIDDIFEAMILESQNKELTPHQRAIRERNIFILELAYSGALRTSEAPNLKIKFLPTRKTVTAALDSGAMVDVTINESKNGKTRDVQFDPMIVESLYDFIDNSRDLIIANRLTNRGHNFRDEGFVFPSLRDGRSISTDWFVKKLKQVRNVDNGINGQKIRRTGLTNIARVALQVIRQKAHDKGELYDAVDAEIYAASMAGHNDKSTTFKNYVERAKMRVFDKDESLEGKKTKAELRIAKRKLEQAENKIKELEKRG
jgi:integrase